MQALTSSILARQAERYASTALFKSAASSQAILFFGFCGRQNMECTTITKLTNYSVIVMRLPRLAWSVSFNTLHLHVQLSQT